MFAVIKTGGKQYRVAPDDLLQVEKVAGEPGEIIQFGEVLVVGGDNVALGTPTVAGASIVSPAPIASPAPAAPPVSATPTTSATANPPGSMHAAAPASPHSLQFHGFTLSYGGDTDDTQKPAAAAETNPPAASPKPAGRPQ